MSSYWKSIISMVKFLEDEPSGKFQAIDNSTDKIYWHYAFREMELNHISEFTNKFDPTQELTLIYLASMCRFLIEHTTCPVMDVFRSSPQIKKYSKCLELINSSVVTGCRRSVLERLASALNAISPTKLIGDYEKALGQAVDDGIEALFKSFPELNFEVYKNSGKPVGSLSTTSLSVQACQSLAECLIRLEKSSDGIYVCYISNPGTLDGWFGFFVKSNGNIFSYNERIDEKYIGQHGNMRNGRYSERKAYELFPYELCEASEEADYKGYAKEINIGEKLSLVGDGFDLIIRMFLSFGVIAQQHIGKTIQGEPVLLNSLLPHNMAMLADKATDKNTTAVVEWKGSSIVEYNAKSVVPVFEVEKVLSGEYNKEFDRPEEGCHFNLGGQAVVDAYGKGFTIKHDEILKSDSSLRLIGNGKSEQEFIGSPERLRTQAYYEVRGQLREYLEQKMERDFLDFGGEEKLGKWYRERLESRKNTILKYCLEAFNAAKTDKDGDYYGHIYLNSDKDKQGDDSRFDKKYPCNAVEVKVCDKIIMDFYGCRMLSMPSNDRFASKRLCWFTGCAASYYFKFNFYDYRQVQEFLGCDLPRFCIGWTRNGWVRANSILDIVDPVSEMILPLTHYGNRFSFDFVVALSKSGINKIRKEI
ncbi:MAG: hypothetical protein IKC27_09130 [Kiritimatiellae bacterium]|nr:hypothetical protein [Kiritimatiellia bacterium]